MYGKIETREPKFDVYVGDYRKLVIRTTHAFHMGCLKRSVTFPKGLMIWGCMTASGLRGFEFIEGTVKAAKYQQIIQNSLLPNIMKLNSMMFSKTTFFSEM